MPTGRPYPVWVCWQCGDKAQPDKRRIFSESTYHEDICDVCKERKPVISGLKRVSKPGCRVYVGKKEIPWVLSGLGIAILSTPKGILTDRQARKMSVGGEVLCYVW